MLGGSTVFKGTKVRRIWPVIGAKNGIRCLEGCWGLLKWPKVVFPFSTWVGGSIFQDMMVDSKEKKTLLVLGGI